MRKLQYVSLLGLLLAALSLPLLAAPLPQVRLEDLMMTMQQLRNNLAALQHQNDNHEAEIRQFEAKLANQDETVEQLRTQLYSNIQQQKDGSKNSQNITEAKLIQLEANSKALANDFKTFKDYYNENSAAQQKLLQRVTALESALDQQHLALEQFSHALTAIADALQIKENPADAKPAAASASGKTYKVKNGDSLGTIAKEHQTTISEIKKLNNLNNDKIIIGQTLKLP